MAGFKTFIVRIQGASALLQHRFGEAAEGALAENTRRVKVGDSDNTPRKQAEEVCYRNKKDGTLYHPSAAICRAIREAAGNHKAKGSRKSMKHLMGGSVICPDEIIPLLDHNDKPLKDFEVDSRPVVIPATKGRVMRHRPRCDQWRMQFALQINTDIVEPKFINDLIVEVGQQIGIGDFRPEKGGPFGRFNLIGWEELK